MNSSGRNFEDAAARLLRSGGYEIIERNYSCPLGEIDIVAREGEILAFVEVKARSSAAFGGALSAVTPAKQRRITRAALCYIKTKKLSPAGVRFDVVAFDGASAGVVKNAFTPGRRIY